LLAVLLALAVACGCGGGDDGAATSRPVPPGSTAPGGRPLSVRQRAVRAAVAYAEEANYGVTFKSMESKVAGGWAKVVVTALEVPKEEVLSFTVFLRQLPDGNWEVAKSGTNITPEDLPDGVPEDLFE